MNDPADQPITATRAAHQSHGMVALGYTTRITTDVVPTRRTLHRSAMAHDAFEQAPCCAVLRDHTDATHLRIVQAQALIPACDAQGGCEFHLLMSALVTLDLPPDALCLGCFTPDIIDSYRVARRDGKGGALVAAVTWEYDTARLRRSVTVSLPAAAVIAHEVAYSIDRDTAVPSPTPSTSVAQWKATVSGHADAVIAGLLAAPDIGDSTVIDDSTRVWHQGIYASDNTWCQIHAAFPLWLYRQVDLTDIDLDAVWEEIRTAFPLATFRAWAAQSSTHRYTVEHRVIGLVTSQLVAHHYDPEAGT